MRKLIPANIDEKNVTSDWIFEDVLSEYTNGAVNIINIPMRKGNSYVGLYNNRLVNAMWKRTENRVTFEFIDTLTNTHTEQDEIQLMDYLQYHLIDQSQYDGEDSGLIAKVQKEMVGEITLILCDFFWEIDE